MWKVLVVDDDKNNCELLAEMLRDRGKCDVANTGQEALSVYNRSLSEKIPYDCILLDIAMPGMSGMDVLKAIREEEAAQGINGADRVAIFMVTVYKELFEQAFSWGCDDFVLKPIDTEKLLMRISEKVFNR